MFCIEKCEEMGGGGGGWGLGGAIGRNRIYVFSFISTTFFFSFLVDFRNVLQ